MFSEISLPVPSQQMTIWRFSGFGSDVSVMDVVSPACTRKFSEWRGRWRGGCEEQSGPAIAANAISASHDSPALQLRIRTNFPAPPPAAPTPAQPAELLDPLPIHPAQFPLDRRQIDAGHLALAHDGAPVDHDIAHQAALPRANNSCSGSTSMIRSRSRRSRSSTTKSAGGAGREFAGAGGAGGGAAVADGERKEFGAGPGALEAEAAMGESAPGASRGSRRRPRRARGRRRRPRWRSRIGARRRSARGRNADAGWTRNW